MVRQSSATALFPSSNLGGASNIIGVSLLAPIFLCKNLLSVPPLLIFYIICGFAEALKLLDEMQDI